MIEVRECPVCNNASFTALANCKDFTVSHETFSIVQCSICSLGITSPRPTNEELGLYYQSDEYISHSGKSAGGIGFIYKIARAIALDKKERLLKKFIAPGSLLDFGCGTGEFLKTAQQRGWKINGIEPSANARKKAEELTLNSIYESLEKFPATKVSAITAWHVLEHVPNLKETLKELSSLLLPQGVLILAVPNYQAPDSEKYKDLWAGYDVPRHLWHFSKTSMTKLLTENNFSLVDVIPMKLDAYYISLLSEKYKNGNKVTLQGLIKAFISGLTSNLKASKNNNYSSLIYIARTT
jgi:2-polyprenyl-3-methyl-5-hydroxy-6-metoxy-1,4-benzoquinol methylase